MHEYGVTERIIEIVLDKIKEIDAPEVKKINIVLGKLTSFVPESIEHYFGFLSKNTPLEKAELKFIAKDMVFHCEDCKEDFNEDDMIFSCPKCNGENIQIISGNEFFIESIEVNDGKD
ncbi:MAG: hydrogenase maturation nickel metallochaperone HypA [Spirochaetes bacterium]|nr:hydrogenase maturation nickel metallochaperone HypA [Spirochaetota bacterium]